MELEEIRRLKLIAENEIENILKEFEKNTGLFVDGIFIDYFFDKGKIYRRENPSLCFEI